MIVGCLAVLLVGLSKGGFGGATALLGMVVLSTVIPPIQAAGVLLPILLVMDAVSLWTWRGQWDMSVIRIMLPGAIVGIGVGWLTAAVVSNDAVRLIVGVVAMVFVVRWMLAARAGQVAPRQHDARRAAVWGTLAGYTSFVAHAGGPPYQLYTLPLRHAPTTFAATSVLFFAVVNTVKVAPYFFLGQFDKSNLMTSLVMVPLAVVAVACGAAIVKRIRAEVFYPIMYVMIFGVAAKLIYDGVTGLI